MSEYDHKIAFWARCLFSPVSDAAAALKYYIKTLNFTELYKKDYNNIWREGASSLI